MVALAGLVVGFAAQAAPAADPPLPSQMPIPPVPEKIPHAMTVHGDTRADPYFWMHERESEALLAHLRAEKAYADAWMEGTEELQDKLFQELKGRIKERDNTVPYLEDGYWWYTRFEEGLDYGIHCRKKGSQEAPEEIVLDENPLARGNDFFSVGEWDVSKDGRILMVATDTVGDRIYDVAFRDMESGAALPDDRLEKVSSNLVFTPDGRHVFYAAMDPETLRHDRIFRHAMGTTQAEDVLVFDEQDTTFNAWVGLTKGEKWIVIGSDATLTSEARIIPVADPMAEPVVFAPRVRGHEYALEHDGEAFFIRSNLEAKNFRILRAELPGGPETWKEIVPHREEILLEDFELFSDHLVLEERRDGLRRLVITKKTNPMGSRYEVPFPDPAYVVYATTNPRLESASLRFVYSSMTAPWSTYEIDLTSHRQELLKVQEIPGGYDAALYVSERVFATAGDGTRVPISLVRRRDLSGVSQLPAPLYLYGYGSYGHSMEASFQSSRLSLLDRGFVFAIAHVRGGEEMGRAWYEDGRLMKKKNSFTDFIACAEHLIAAGMTTPQQLVISGGSAGGLLVGACANLRPDLFRIVVADVPFVDVVTTMLDESLPLTSGEWDEWGNPKQEAAYRYMLSYSPYDQVSRQPYPTMLVTAGFHDSQVQYWEPAKWVARLREHSTSGNPIVFKIEMEVGHAGKSGRFESLHEVAYEFAFLIKEAGLEERLEGQKK